MSTMSKRSPSGPHALPLISLCLLRSWSSLLPMLSFVGDIDLVLILLRAVCGKRTTAGRKNVRLVAIATGRARVGFYSATHAFCPAWAIAGSRASQIKRALQFS